MDAHLINIRATLLQALKKINALSGAAMTLFAIDDASVVRGTVTDGDIRRALISGAPLSSTVSEAMHRNFTALRQGDDDVVDILREARARGLRLLPVVNADGQLTEIIDLSKCATRLPLSAILMAGGKGERLRPLTLSTPKPLLKIGDRPIIDYNIQALMRCGITDITVTTGYLAEQIHDHFRHHRPPVRCVREDKPLGTIGAAGLVPLPKDGFTLVMNADLLTNINLEDMYVHHRATGSDITIAAIPYQVSVPYAILAPDAQDPQRVYGLQEKPSYSFMANAGIYIFPNRLLRSLPTDTRTDATDLIEAAIAEGLKVTSFPIDGTWIDIGSPADFRQAETLMKRLREFSSGPGAPFA